MTKHGVSAEPVNVAALLRDARDLIRRHAPARSSEAERVAAGLHRLANVIDKEIKIEEAPDRRKTAPHP